jgi:hypothetical protein
MRGPKGTKRLFVNFVSRTTKHLLQEINVPDAESCGFADPEPQPVEEREDRPVGWSPKAGVVHVGQGLGGIKQSPGSGWIKEEGNPRRGGTPGLGLERRSGHEVSCDQPVEQAPHDPEQLVIAVR